MGRDTGMAAQNTIGCVLFRRKHTFDVRKDGVKQVLTTVKNYLKGQFLLSDVRRRRDDLEPEVLGDIYTAFRLALIKEDISTLNRLLNSYEFRYYEKQITDSKKNVSLKDLTNRGSSTVNLTKVNVVAADSIDFASTDYLQITLKVQGTMTTHFKDGTEKEEEIHEYCAFELASDSGGPADAIQPIKICGRYDADLDRIGEDGVDPNYYFSNMG